MAYVLRPSDGPKDEHDGVYHFVGRMGRQPYPSTKDVPSNDCLELITKGKL